jgi:hypothetical protein
MVLCFNKMSFTNIIHHFTFIKKYVIKFLKGYRQYVSDINNMKPDNLHNNNNIIFPEDKI